MLAGMSLGEPLPQFKCRQRVESVPVTVPLPRPRPQPLKKANTR